MESPASLTRRVATCTHALSCERGCSSITPAQVAPYNPLILTPAWKPPNKVTYVYSKSKSLPAASHTISPVAGCRLLAASDWESAPSGADRSHGAGWGSSWQWQTWFQFDWWFVSCDFSHDSLSPLLQIFVLLLQFNLPPFLKNVSGVPWSLFNPANGHFRQTSSLLLSSQCYQFWGNHPPRTDSVEYCIPLHSLSARCFPTTPVTHNILPWGAVHISPQRIISGRKGLDEIDIHH